MAVKQNLIIDQGSTFSQILTAKYANGVTISNTEGYSANAQMRKSPTSSSAKEFTCSVGNTGNVTISMTATETSNVEAGRWLYDVEIASGSEVIRIVEGIITVTPEITR